ITPETKSDEVTESNAENLLPIPSECEVTLEDKSKCDVPIFENSPICDDHSDNFSVSKIDDDISVYDDDFKDIEYVEASLSDPEIVNQEEEEVDLKVVSQIQDVVLREKLLSITRLISNIESLNDNSIPDCVLNSFESNNSLLDNFSPEFETFCDHTKETRSEADLFLAFDNSIPPGIENVADDSEGDILPRPPSKPPDVETDAREEIPVALNDKDKFDEDYYFFMIDKVFSLLFAESEDTIFDPVISD
nr:hypothetical protein [Tanacetum cinerariifolium]